MRFQLDRDQFRCDSKSRWRGVGRAAALVGSMALSGCGLFPSDGPSPQSVVSEAKTAGAPYVLVALNPQAVALLAPHKTAGLHAMGPRRPAPHVLLGIGDVVSVTIFEAASGGLFIPSQGSARPGNFVQLPDQSVDNAGNITVPYAGAVRAAGRSIPDIQADIVNRLKSRAIEPQVVVTLKDQKASQVSVLGEVNSPSRFAITPSGDRILDVIAKAGGPKYPGYQSFVTLQRSGKEGTELFNDLVDRPADNIYVRPGDIVVVANQPKSFVALGASGKNGQIDFEAEQMTLAEALGKAGGLLDYRANPQYVFVYRLENKHTLDQIGQTAADAFPGAEVPTIYSVDLRRPQGYFLASQFFMRDKDVLYATNSPVADLNKVFDLVRGSALANHDVRSF
jgi:polysaccharide export outer membrane protein